MRSEGSSHDPWRGMAFHRRVPNMQAVASAPSAPPVRSISQCLEALHAANEKRTHRAAVKRELKTRKLGLFDAIDDPLCDTMKVRDVLVSIRGLGETKVDAIMRDAMIAPGKTCAGITTNQRMRLATTLASRHPYMPIVYRAPELDSVLDPGTMDA